MEIISVSLEEGQVAQVGTAMKKLGFRSRSKLLRAAIDSLLHEHTQIEKLKGFQKTVITVSHRMQDERGVMQALHEFEDLVETSMHQQSGSKCVEIVIAQGNAERVKKLYDVLKTARGVECVNCFVL